MSEFTWTAEQSAAIRRTEHTLLTASAGTGKTTTVIGKILWHLGLPIALDENGTPVPICPEQHRLTLDRLAAITFTEKAAHDLKSKLREHVTQLKPELRWDIDKATVGTIHGFCGELLREHAFRLGIDPGFAVIDEVESRLELDRVVEGVVTEALADHDESVISLVQRFTLHGHQYSEGTLGLVRDALRDLRWHQDRYDAWSAGFVEPLAREILQRLHPEWDEKDDAALEDARTLVRLGAIAKNRWEEHQDAEGVRDFDSLILTARDLLRSTEGANALAALRRRLSLLIIDEFQDTDGAQRDIAYATAGIGDGGSVKDNGPLLFLVGDPKQSIYRFRGADIAVWNEVKSALGSEATLELSHNFRSTPEVVDFVNRFAEPTFRGASEAVAAAGGTAGTAYHMLRATRCSIAAPRIEWMDSPGPKRAERTWLEAQMVAARIRDVVIDAGRGDTEGIQICDPATGEMRDCSYRDVAILFRSRTPVPELERALQEYGVPYYLAGDAGLVERREIEDLVALLEIVDNPRNDMAAFAVLRSPFVGLRDEVIARIRFEAPGGSLLRQAQHFLNDAGEFVACDRHPEIAAIEREALRAALGAVLGAVEMRTRAPIDRLVEGVLDRTGYRLHLMLMDQPEPKLANIQRFLALMGHYRSHTVGSFLDMWGQMKKHDLGIPQAALYSKSDDVVTLSTIHSAKGLEWPVVLLVDVNGTISDRSTNKLVTDRLLGPVLAPKIADRGPRSLTITNRAKAEEYAEEVRLMYVASTRARDLLVIASPHEKASGLAEMLKHGEELTEVTRDVPQVEIPTPPPLPRLEWIDLVQPSGVEPELTRPVAAVTPIRRAHSATELMTHAKGRREWRLKYLHGIVPSWYFARSHEKGTGVPSRVKGVIVHDVLERIREESEVNELLELAIGSLDAPELTERLSAGTAYRRQLEAEIRQVVSSDEWKWYVEGRHYREMTFVQLRPGNKWRVGAFDLFRPDERTSWIIDFKTHDIDAEATEKAAADYRLQAAVYRAAASAMHGPVRVRFHFTKPNVIVDG